MRFTNKTDIFFDLDHTLWDFERNSALTFEFVFKNQGVNVNLPEFLKLYVPINVKYWELYRKDKITHIEMRYKRLKEIFDLVSYQIDDSAIDLISQEYIECLPTFNHLFDGAIEILDYLKPKYNLHIITNGFQDVQNGKLKNANIEHYFTTITNSEMAGAKKPNPKIFEFALQLAKAKKETSLMIGDCLEADVGGAKNFGIDALFFNENKIETPHNFPQIYHLSEIKNIL